MLLRPVLYSEVGGAARPVAVDDAEVAGAGVPGLEGREVEVPQEHHTHPGVILLRPLDSGYDVLALVVRRGVPSPAGASRDSRRRAKWAVVRGPPAAALAAVFYLPLSNFAYLKGKSQLSRFEGLEFQH